MNNVEILIKAKSFIDTPEKWHKGDWANNEGTCFCSMGAIAKALGHDVLDIMNNYKDVGQLHKHQVSLILQKAMSVDPNTEKGCVADINDHDETTHAEIMGYFDKAIELAKGVTE